jgi:Dolichyl-phosphate-mannose-protein mannosyltransferase
MLLLVGTVVRVWSVLAYRNPTTLIFSDAARHWDNAKRFLDPGPMGCSNPYLYQLFLFLVRRATADSALAIGVITTALSLAYPLSFYLFARSVCRHRVNALRAAAVLALLPTHVSMFSFFMNETLLLPLMGFALYTTVEARKRRSGALFLLTATLWVAAILTRAVVLPVALLACGYALSPQRRRIALALSAGLVTAAGFGAAARHAYPYLHRYTPFGDGSVVSVYFASAARDYQVTYAKRYTYGFSSPSLYISPFDPFFPFKSIREGKFTFTIDPEKEGADVRAAYLGLSAKNRAKMPRLVFENLVYLTFGHAWPDAGKDNPPGRICLWERWIWPPLLLVAVLGAILHLRRRGPSFVPVLTLFFALSLYGSSVLTMMEGRYRRPLEPLLVVAVFFLLDARRARPAFGR